jgi:hypothetical protein
VASTDIPAAVAVLFNSQFTLFINVIASLSSVLPLLIAVMEFVCCSSSFPWLFEKSLPCQFD